MLVVNFIRCRLLFIVLLSTCLPACNKLLDVTPADETSVGQAFSDSAFALSAVTGIYHKMVTHGHFEWSGLSYHAARSADEVAWPTGMIDYFERDSLLYTDYDVRTMWSQGFNSLFLINTCIKGLQSTPQLSAGLQRQLLGESLFCRAFVNFYLVNLWGDAIPLITTPDMEVNKVAKSVPQQQVYDQIMADLLRAQALLSTAYAGEGRVRPNLAAASALLARVYLYRKRYSDAITQANRVINSDLYTPLQPPGTVFLQTSQETIWQLMPPTNKLIDPVGDALIHLGTASSLTPQLSAAFEPGDVRRLAWVVENILSGKSYTTAGKYRNRASVADPASAEYYVVLRLAEQYLIRAEAYARLGNTAAAVADLNIIRARAGLPRLPASLDQQQCMLAVEQERRVELFTEWGHRWFDLKRWPGMYNPAITRADEVLGAVKSDWQSADQWYPVPRPDLQLNPNLVQNPGYPAR